MNTYFEARVCTKDKTTDVDYIYHDGEFATLEEAIKRMDEMVDEILAETDEYVVGRYVWESDGYSYRGDELSRVREELGV